MESQAMDTIFQISSILRKHVQKQSLSTEEHDILQRWLDLDSNNIELLRSLTDESQLAAALIQLHQTNTNGQLMQFNRRVQRKGYIRSIRIWSSVAALFLCIMGAWIFYHRSQDKYAEAIQTASMYGDEVLPGSNKATLTLSSGKSINLDGEQTGIIINDEGLMYEDGSTLNGIGSSATYATLSTPRGGQYKVTLADGTRVWLNAGSSLVYPIHFAQKEREVKLLGEAFFEVSHNAVQPFVVHTKKQQVKVLGTSFNIRAYGDNELTTLVKGKVAIKSPYHPDEKSLIPGQQAVVGDDVFTLKNVDPSEFMAWTTGVIVGGPVGLQEIVQDIVRWYDVEFLYPTGFINREKAYINLDRNEKLSSVLQALEHTYNVKFQIRGKEVIVR